MVMKDVSLMFNMIYIRMVSDIMNWIKSFGFFEMVYNIIVWLFIDKLKI